MRLARALDRSVLKPGLPARLRAFTFDAVLAESVPVSLSIACDPLEADGGRVIEIAIKPTGRSGREGGGLQLLFEDLGIGLSRAVQGRDPISGEDRLVAFLSVFPMPLRFMDEFGQSRGMTIAVRLQRDPSGDRVTTIGLDLAETEPLMLRRMFEDLAAALNRAIGRIWSGYAPLREKLAEVGFEAGAHTAAPEANADLRRGPSLHARPEGHGGHHG